MSLLIAYGMECRKYAPHSKIWIKLISLGAYACLASLAHASDADINADIFGQWTTISILDTADIAGMSDREARKLIGKRLEIGPDALKFAGESCKSPSYSRSVREPAKYIREEWHARSGNLGLPNPVTTIDAQCTDLFLTGTGRMVFNWNGFFFNAKKLTNPNAFSRFFFPSCLSKFKYNPIIPTATHYAELSKKIHQLRKIEL